MNYTDTIVAVSSAGGGVRAIVRLSGPDAHRLSEAVFKPASAVGNPAAPGNPRGEAHKTRGSKTHPTSESRLQCGVACIDDDLMVDARGYRFFAPHSYTGEDLAELHVFAGDVLVEALVRRLLAAGARPAGPGEFTARAYLNGKLDLAQAEAVNEIIAGSNRLQLDAAERLLSGRLTRSTNAIRSALLDCLSLIEAGLDFSGEQIEFISAEQAAERLSAIAANLEDLLEGSIRYESLLELPAIGIAGAPNAGKSTLLNRLLGQDRSIVSDQPKTTRDVLSGLLKTDRFQCVLFDCAGLLAEPQQVIDRLAQQAATEALKRCRAVLFCVDAAKCDWSEDLAVRSLIESEHIVFVATKTDLLAAEGMSVAVEKLGACFGAAFLPISAVAEQGLDKLREQILSACLPATAHRQDDVAMTTRHQQTVSEALANVRQAAVEIEQGNEEVAAALIRAAHESLAGIAQPPLDEQVLDRIFTRFCIGK